MDVAGVAASPRRSPIVVRREAAVRAEVTELLGRSRLLMLTEAGGSGKAGLVWSWRGA
jgi:hypothetical protein